MLRATPAARPSTALDAVAGKRLSHGNTLRTDFFEANGGPSADPGLFEAVTAYAFKHCTFDEPVDVRLEDFDSVTTRFKKTEMYLTFAWGTSRWSTGIPVAVVPCTLCIAVFPTLSSQTRKAYWRWS